MLSYWAKSKKNIEALLVASKEDGQGIHADKIEYIFCLFERMQERHNIKKTNKYFENMTQLK
jgi:hypothetical protein